MQCVNEKTGRDADRFRHVVVLSLIALLVFALSLDEYGYQPRCRFKERFLLIGAKRGKVFEPFVSCLAAIECSLFDFGSLTDASFYGRIADADKIPRLRFAPLGAVPAARIAASITALGTERDEKSRTLCLVFINSK